LPQSSQMFLCSTGAQLLFSQDFSIEIEFIHPMRGAKFSLPPSLLQWVLRR